MHKWRGEESNDPYRDVSYGFVFRKLSDQLKENWTVTFSHEALELIGDPESNLLVAGPHPGDDKKEVFHWYEMCDAVQSETYTFDGIEVSNFVLPLYFTLFEEKGGRNAEPQARWCRIEVVRN